MKNWVVQAFVRAQMRLWEAVAQEMAGSLARPDGDPHAHAPGPDRARILLVGSGAALGWGVRCHDLAIPGSLARALAAATGRGVDVDVVADRAMGPSEVAAAVRGAAAHRFDAIVVTVGYRAAVELAVPAGWERDIRLMLDDLHAVIDGSVRVVLLGIPVPRLEGVPSWAERIVRAHARSLDRCTASAAIAAGELSVPVGPDDADFLERASVGYARLGGAIAAALAPALRGSPRRGEWTASPLEEPRQAAVDRMVQAADVGSPRVRRLVEMTRSALGADAALFTILDGSTHRQAAWAGVDVGDFAREHSLCQHTILQPAGLVVEDTLQDARFRDNPLVTARERPLRFYAGYPVESPDGYPIGALCVIDSQPRAASEVDTVLLREFALLIQRELWNSSRVLT